MRPLIRTRLVPSHLQHLGNVRPNNGNIIRKARDRLEEPTAHMSAPEDPTLSLSEADRANSLPKQDKDPITLHQKPHQRPPRYYKPYTKPEGQCTAPFGFAGEEEEGASWAEEEGYADEEEDVAHGEEGAVEEEEEAECEEDKAWGWVLVEGGRWIDSNRG